MNRRTMLQALGSLMGTALLEDVLRPEDKRPAWQTAIGLNGFMSSSQTYQKEYPIREILDFANRQQFDGVELVDGWPLGGYPAAKSTDRIAALKRLYDSFHLQVFSIQLGAAGAFDPSAEVRRSWLKEFRDRAQFAKQVGCDCVGLWPGGPLRGQTIDEAIACLADSFREAGKVAHDHGLLAAFEIEPPFVFNREEHLVRILERANHSSLKVIYDPSHFDLMNGSTGKPHEMLKRIGVEKIGYIHLTDTDGTMRHGTSKHIACGDGHANIATSLAFLRKEGFQGWIMIDAWMIPDPYDACRKGKQAIQRAMAETP